MSLLSVLKSVGKDLSHVGTWIDDGLKVAIPVVSTVDPALGPIFTSIEAVLNKLPTTGASTVPSLTAAQLQGIVTAVAMLEGVTQLSKPAATSS